MFNNVVIINCNKLRIYTKNVYKAHAFQTSRNILWTGTPKGAKWVFDNFRDTHIYKNRRTKDWYFYCEERGL